MSVRSAPSKTWPVLVVDLADPAARDVLTGIALAGGAAELPLLAEPATASTHLLEVYTPGDVEPLVLFAEPLGAATSRGFPLQLRPYDPHEVTPSFASGVALKSRLRDSSRPSPDRLSERRPRAPTDARARTGPEPVGEGERLASGPEALVGRAIAGGKLRIDSVIGTGGVGVVYRASHRDLRIPVAVKILHENFQGDAAFCRRFHAEALAASRLDHPHLMRVVDFGQESDGLLYLAMEHLDGVCFADILEPGKPLPLARIVDVMMQVCAGLAHAHSRGIVHRDVKPDNIVLIANRDDDDRPEELAKVCDFGIAVQETDGVESRIIAGTPDYMSPEQCRGDTLDGRSDVYSCGVILYELATGQVPFGGDTPVAILDQHMNVAPFSPRVVRPDVDPRLEAIIVKALAKEPADRQPSMRDLRRELGALLTPMASVPPSHGAPSPSGGPVSQAPVSQAPAAGAPVSQSESPEWLERGVYRHGQVDPIATAAHGRMVAAELAARPSTWLTGFVQAQRPERFEWFAARLDAALPILLADRNVKALFAIRCTLDELAAAGARRPAFQIARARQLQQAFNEPAFLSFLAEGVLAQDRPPREISELVLRIAGPVTYALYSARLKLSDQPAVRRRFVLMVRELGTDALPMIRAGLARLESRRAAAVAALLAADLFLASPRVRDEEAGMVSARYLHESPPGLAGLALEALVGFWGPRATPLLIDLVGSPDERVSLTAINGLRELSTVDEIAVLRIASAVRLSPSADVRAAGRAALRETSGKTHVVALRALEQLA